jgi:hypothetical protein
MTAASRTVRAKHEMTIMDGHIHIHWIDTPVRRADSANPTAFVLGAIRSPRGCISYS